MKIAVLGSGAWGTALAILLFGNGHEVTLWSHREERAREIESTGQNPALKGIPIPPAMAQTSSIDCVKGCPLVLFATPSFAIRETARMAAPYLEEDVLLVSATKGIEAETGLRMTEILRQEVGKRCKVIALSGPSHAEEVSRRIPTGVVAAAEELETAEQVQDVFMSNRFRVYTNPDIVGVELGGALKNVIALCCGISDGMGLGDNTKALMMTRGMTEMARLGVALGGRTDTFAGLSGIGDLIVTCTSMHSRNRRAGILIGQGLTAQAAMRQVGATVEGYFAAKSAYLLAEKVEVEMPICRCAYEVLYQDRPVRDVVEELMQRQRRGEVDESWIGG